MLTRREERRQNEVRRLLASGPMYGLGLVAGSKHLKRGTIYFTLTRMEEAGEVTSEPEPRMPGYPGKLRRIYSLVGEHNG